MSDQAEFHLTVTSTDLLAALRDPSNHEVWGVYVSRYRPLIVRYCTRLGLHDADAEDVAQTTLATFSRAYREGKYERERGRLRVWLFAIARNQLNTWHRQRREKEIQVGGSSDATDFFAGMSGEDKSEEIWEQEWREAVVRQCLAEIRREVDPKTFEAFELFASQGLSAEEVGRRLGMSANAVFSAKRRILRRIRELLPTVDETF